MATIEVVVRGPSKSGKSAVVAVLLAKLAELFPGQVTVDDPEVPQEDAVVDAATGRAAARLRRSGAKLVLRTEQTKHKVA